MSDRTAALTPSFATGQGIICAGLPRSGTLSLATALGILGVGPIHHGLRDTDAREVYAWTHAAWCSFPFLRAHRLASRDGRLPFYLPPYDPLLPWTRANWDRLVGRYRCTTDVGSMFSEQLIGAYPEARVILVERPVDEWARSFGRLLIDRTFYGVGGFIKSTLGPWADVTTTTAYSGVVMGWLGANSRREAHELLHGRHRQHYEMVRRLVPAEQLLEFDLKEGWEPLCKFLDLPVPDVPFPRVNEQAAFLRMLRNIDLMILKGLAQRIAWWALLSIGVTVFISRAATRRALIDVFKRTLA